MEELTMESIISFLTKAYQNCENGNHEFVSHQYETECRFCGAVKVVTEE